METETVSGTGLVVRSLGRVPYAEAWELQRRLVAERGRGEGADTLLVCEHEPVVTTGRGTRPGFLRASRFEVIDVERGGQATYHGPGQIVVYPIVALAVGARDMHRWMAALQQSAVLTCADFGLDAGGRSGATGVWIEAQRKLASIGVAAQRWVTWHGMAFNHDPDLSHFGAIEPCGFDATVMTSLAAELGDRCPTQAATTSCLVEHLVSLLQPFRELRA